MSSEPKHEKRNQQMARADIDMAKFFAESFHSVYGNHANWRNLLNHLHPLPAQSHFKQVPISAHWQFGTESMDY